MRTLITGVDESGRSCVVSDTEQQTAASGAGPSSVKIGVAARTTEAPPPPRPQGFAMSANLGVEPGCVTWYILDFEPNGEIFHHHTDTVDFVTVVSGDLTLVLDDGRHPLQPGDFVMMNGTDHSWQSGPAGARASAVCLGSARRDE
jgi:quercetin dioxygenase-like cupin family protein